MKLDIKVREEIAKETVNYLKDLMYSSRDIIATAEETVVFDNFMTLYNKYDEIIKREQELLQNRKPTNSMIINGSKVPMLNLMTMLQDDLVKKKAKLISLTDAEIDELLDYVRESIEKCGLGDLGCCENEIFFLRDTLRRLMVDMALNSTDASLEKYKRVSDFVTYVYLNDTIAIHPEFSGQIEFGYDNTFNIIDHHMKTICFFNKAGINEVKEENHSKL